MKEPKKYYFQFNGDVDSCLALASMFRDKWEIKDFDKSDGYTWIILINYYL